MPNTGQAGRTNTRRWRDVRRRVLAASGGVCAICGEWIDLTLSGRHRDGPTVDHIVPISLGGAPYDLANLRAAHNRCNVLGRAVGPQRPHNSRDWFGGGS